MDRGHHPNERDARASSIVAAMADAGRLARPSAESVMNPCSARPASVCVCVCVCVLFSMAICMYVCIRTICTYELNRYDVYDLHDLFVCIAYVYTYV